MKKYEHTQPAVTILIITGAIALTMACVGLFQKQLLIAAAILTLISWLFRSITIEVTETELIWRFGGGWFRKRVPLDEIASVKVVRTNVLEGWGIHLSRFGWLYNVSGFDAIAVTMDSGKRFALGTDEAEKLAAILKAENA